MSEATATATAIPREINLGLQKPVATPAYTRRFKSQSQTVESTAGTQATITLDTAQPGSFIDTLDSYLSFTLRLTNTSTTAGYNVSFSSCGAQGLIRAMRIYVQGVPIEEITEYNALVEWLHDLSGIPDYCDRSAKSRYLANTMMDDYFVYLPPKSAAAGSSDSTRDINIQLPLVSGVLGTMADKMFPSMLVAPGNCYIQLDLATAQNALRIQEVDVSNLTVGTAGVNTYNVAVADNAAAKIPLCSSLTATAMVSNLIDTSLTPATNRGATIVPGQTILEDRPYDAPFITGPDATIANANRCGVITTEERIGGGMFGPTQPSATRQMWVGKDCAASDASGTVVENNTTTVVIATNSGSSNTNSNVFLGSGLNTSGAVQAGTSRKMNTSTINVNYSILNLEYIGKQVVVGDDVARAIIERAAAGDISIHTQSYRQYSNTIPLSGWSYKVDPAYNDTTSSMNFVDGNPLVNFTQRVSGSVTQSIIVPAKISSANAIYHIFRNGAGIEDFQFDSLRRMTVGFTDGPGVDGGSTTVTAQLRIGNELIPQSPIQSASEALEELLKAHHMDGFYGTCEKMGSIVLPSVSMEWLRSSSLLALRYAGTTAAATLIPREVGINNSAVSTAVFGGARYVQNDFNSQILCPNPDSVTFKYPGFGVAGGTAVEQTTFFAGVLNGGAPARAYNFYRSDDATGGTHGHFYLGGTVPAALEIGANYYAETGLEFANRAAKWQLAVRKAFFGYADERSDHQLRDPTKKNFMHPYKQHTGRYSTFMLGFDLDTFSHNSETIRSGHYLGNNTVSLNLTNAQFVDNSPLNQALCSSVRMDTYVLHDLRLSFQAGGIVQAFY